MGGAEPSDLGHTLCKWSYWWYLSTTLTGIQGVEYMASYNGIKSRSLKESCARHRPHNSYRMHYYREFGVHCRTNTSPRSPENILQAGQPCRGEEQESQFSDRCGQGVGTSRCGRMGVLLRTLLIKVPVGQGTQTPICNMHRVRWRVGRRRIGQAGAIMLVHLVGRFHKSQHDF